MLKEVQMPPRLLLGVLHRATRPLTLRAREPGSLREIEPEIQPLTLTIELDTRDVPRVAQPERCLEQKKILRLHPTAPIIDDQKPVRRNQPDRTLPTLIVEEPRFSTARARRCRRGLRRCG
jgi:hypothetical protein